VPQTTQHLLCQTHIADTYFNFYVELRRYTTGALSLWVNLVDNEEQEYDVYLLPHVGAYNHLVFWYDGSNLNAELFVDGTEVDSDSSEPIGNPFRAPAATDRVWAGAYPYDVLGTYKYPFHGYISEIRLWDVVRSQANRTAYSNRELDPEDADWSHLLCYVKCDDGRGPILKDYSQNNRPAFVHRGCPVPADGILSRDPSVRGLMFNGFDYGIVDCTTSASGDPLEAVRAGGKHWTVELFLQPWGQSGTGANLGNELGILNFGDPAHPLFQLFLNDTTHKLTAVVSVAGPTDYTLTSDTVPLNGMPVHLVLRREQNNVELIVNGTTEDTAAVGNNDGYTVTATSIYNRLYVGWSRDGGHDDWIGLLSELRIWDRARSDNEIDRWAWRRLHDVRDDQAGSGLIGYWPMEAVYIESDADGEKSVGRTPCLVHPVAGKSSDSMAMTFTEVESLQESYMAEWGVSGVLRRSPAIVRAIGQEQTVLPKGDFPLRPERASVSRRVLVHAGAGLFKQNKDRWDTLAGRHDPNVPVSFTGVGGYTIATNGLSPNRKIGRDESVSVLGIAPPSLAPTYKGTDEGVLTGCYAWAYRFKNNKTGVVSTVSPRLVLDDEDALSTEHMELGFPILSTDPQVDEIEIFRTESQASESDAEVAPLYYLATVSNETSTYQDNNPDTDLGDVLDDDNVQFPPCRYCVMYKNLLVMAGNADSPNTVYMSQAANFEAVGEQYEIGQDDGYEITGLFVLGGVLYVCKERGIYALQGDSARTMAVVAFWPDRGVIAHHAVTPF